MSPRILGYCGWSGGSKRRSLIGKNIYRDRISHFIVVVVVIRLEGQTQRLIVADAQLGSKIRRIFKHARYVSRGIQLCPTQQRSMRNRCGFIPGNLWIGLQNCELSSFKSRVVACCIDSGRIEIHAKHLISACIKDSTSCRCVYKITQDATSNGCIQLRAPQRCSIDNVIGLWPGNHGISLNYIDLNGSRSDCVVVLVVRRELNIQKLVWAHIKQLTRARRVVKNARQVPSHSCVQLRRAESCPVRNIRRVAPGYCGRCLKNINQHIIRHSVVVVAVFRCEGNTQLLIATRLKHNA